MVRTKLFRNGNSQAVRIPAELAYAQADTEPVIERHGDELRIRPAPRRMGDVLDTNICIYLMKHQPTSVRARFAACFVGNVVMSAITYAELQFGVAASRKVTQAANRAALD